MQRGLSEEAQGNLVAKLRAASAVTGPAIVQTQRPFPPALSLDDLGLQHGPETPAWIRTDAERQRLNQALDEAVSVASDVTTEVTTNAGAVSDAITPGSKSPASENGECRTSSNVKEDLTEAEQQTCEKYKDVFGRLHADIDLLVLRCPRVGEAAVSLCRALVEGLIHVQKAPDGNFPLHSSHSRPQVEKVIGSHEIAVLRILERCSREILGVIRNNHDGTTLQGFGFKENQQGNVSTTSCGRQRHRFSKSMTTHSTKHFAAPCNMGVGGSNLAESCNGFLAENDVVAVEVKCRNALRRKIGDFVMAKVSQHFGALQDQLTKHEVSQQLQSEVSLDTLDL